MIIEKYSVNTHDKAHIVCTHVYIRVKTQFKPNNVSVGSRDHVTRNLPDNHGPVPLLNPVNANQNTIVVLALGSREIPWPNTHPTVTQDLL